MYNFFDSKNNILLSNLINIRWIAIFGQILAILFVYFILSISIPIILCLAVILVSIIINLTSFFLAKKNNYLRDIEAFYFLFYDTIQLSALLYLTGGIYNPFSLLLLAPIVISASHLRIEFTFYYLFFLF